VPASHDFFISVAPTAAREHVSAGFGRAGWRVTDVPGYGVEVSRGSVVATRILGAMAMRAFHVSLRIELFGTQDGSSVARLHRSLGRPALGGGTWSAAHADRAFRDAANVLHATLERAGVLTGRVANARPAA
jgi:hypothetical protein